MPTYIRFIIIFALSVFMNTQSIQQTQADEFGNRFWSQSNASFGEPSAAPQNELLATDMDAMAAALQDIQPAAGDESNGDNAEILAAPKPENEPESQDKTTTTP